MTATEIMQMREIEMAYCKANLEYFIETYCHIEVKDGEDLIQPVTLWPKQRETLQIIGSNKLTAILKARQLGLTWTVLYYAIHTMLFKTGRTVLALSRSEIEAKELVRRIVMVLQHMPALIQSKGNCENGWCGITYEATALQVKIHFGSNKPDSVFNGYASSPDSGRSFTADLLLIDEWATQQFAEEIWSSVFPTINAVNGGKVVGLSTIKRGSFFEKIFTDPDNNFAKVFLSCFSDPSRDQEWYEQTEKALTGSMTQEYPRTVEEALAVPGGSYFPEVMEETHIATELSKKDVIRYVALDYGLDMLSVHWIEVDSDGYAIAYREYDAPDQTIAAACDTILDLSEGENIALFLAPPDLWSRSQMDGRGRNVHFAEGGIYLTKTSNDYINGCASIKEDVSTLKGRPKFQMLEGTCPNLMNSFKKVQKDKIRPNVYAKTPHDLTHDLDSIRCFSVYWTSKGKERDTTTKKKLPRDIMEDYRNANKETREIMRERYGAIY